MNYSLSPASKPGFPTVTRDGLSATFTSAPKDEPALYVLARVPTEFGTGWRVCGECDTFSPEAVLQGLANGSITPPNEAWT